MTRETRRAAEAKNANRRANERVRASSMNLESV